jgi:hypothetical protein
MFAASSLRIFIRKSGKMSRKKPCGWASKSEDSLVPVAVSRSRTVTVTSTGPLLWTDQPCGRS